MVVVAAVQACLELGFHLKLKVVTIGIIAIEDATDGQDMPVVETRKAIVVLRTPRVPMIALMVWAGRE